MKPRKGQKIWQFLQKNPKAWTKGWYAFTKCGDRTFPNNRRACKWCSTGLIMLFYPERQYSSSKVLVPVIKTDNIPRWNDSPKRTVQQVIAAFKKAGL